MKTISFIIASLLLVGITSCKTDNYERPKSTLTGTVIYNGQAVGVRGTGEAVQLQLWQPGYALSTPIPVYVNQDGTFSATLFDGNYKLVARDGNGPWVNAHDTIDVKVSGATKVDYPVKPFFSISNETFTIDGDSLRSSFDVTQNVSTATIGSMYLLVDKTIFVDLTQNIRQAKANGIIGHVNMSLYVGDLLTTTNVNQQFLFARVAVQTNDIGEGIYSTIKQIKGN